MKIHARVNKALTVVFIEKQTDDGPIPIELKEAKRIYNDGDITGSNLCFQALIAADFDTKKVLKHYRESREELASE